MVALRLGVNVDHVATLRQQRGTRYPDPVYAAAIAEQAGADQITIHLREDRRHIVDRDLRVMRETVQVPLNLEMAVTEEMVGLALKYKPDTVTLVPEKREERTTEGGLDVLGQMDRVRDATTRLKDAGIAVSLFIDPAIDQVAASQLAGATIIELHTGDYCDGPTPAIRAAELERLRLAAIAGHELGLVVAAGHGIDYRNVHEIAALPHVEELNIGHSIVCQAVFVGFERAVAEMIAAMVEGQA
ncbi:MAG: pyridoxine 5'-phosphate synthase [Myxococcales bacterium]|nr:pyridoxine 5'-phosphate synthase [Myxococcales bacterium]